MTNADIAAADNMRKRLATLPPREERLVRLRYGIGSNVGPLNERDIAAKLGMSETDVREQLEAAFAKLR